MKKPSLTDRFLNGVAKNLNLPILFTTIITIIELTHCKTILENTVEIEPQPVALDFKNLSQYSSCSK